MLVVKLSQGMARQNTQRLLELADLVDAPLRHAPEFIWDDVMPDGAKIHGKWDHSLVAFQGDRIVGLALGYERSADDPHSESYGLYAVSELHLSLLAVDPLHQGVGIGKTLLFYFARAAIRSPFYWSLPGPIEYIGLTTDAENSEGPQRLYRSFGLEEVGRQPRSGVNKIIMRAPLGAIEASSAYKKLALVVGSA